jgi:hypothetical protein
MAYAFKKIDEMVQGNEGDVFGGDAPAMNSQSPVQPAQVVQTKTSTEGELGEPTAVEGSGRGVSNRSPQERTRLIQQNIGKTQAPIKGVADVQQKIATNQRSLQSEADRYQQGYKKNYNYDVSNDSLRKAIQGDEESFSKSKNLLNKTQADAAPTFGDVNKYQSNSDVNLLTTDAGIQELAGRGQGPRYTQGMGALDAMLLKKDPRFNRLVSQIKGQNESLNEALGTTPDRLEAEANQYGQRQLSDAQTQAERYLQNYQDSLESSNVREAEQYNQYLKDLDQAKVVNETDKAAREQVSEELSAIYGDRIADQIAGVNVDPRDFINFDRGGYGYKDFLNESEASQFNRLGSLLGSGQLYDVGTLRPKYTADSTGLYNAISGKAIDARNAADIAGQSRIDQILSDANLLADETDERRLGLMDRYGQDLTNTAQQIALENPNLGQYYDPEMLAGYSRPEQFADLTGADVLGAGQVSELNKLSQDLGLQNRYQVGGSADISDPTQLLNEQDFRTWLTGELKNRQNVLANQGVSETVDGPLLSPGITGFENPNTANINPFMGGAIIASDPLGVKQKPDIIANDRILNPARAGTFAI